MFTLETAVTPEATPPEVGQRLSAARHTRGLSQATVARRAGIAASYLSRIENGKVQPTYVTLMRIVRALRVDLDRILVERPEPARSKPCPISPDGRCMLDLIRGQTEVWRDPHGEFYSAREVRVLRKLAAWMRAAKPERLRAIEVLLEDLMLAAERGEDDGIG